MGELALALVCITVLPENAGLNIPMDFQAGIDFVGASKPPANDHFWILALALSQRRRFRFQRLNLSQLVAGLPQE